MAVDLAPGAALDLRSSFPLTALWLGEERRRMTASRFTDAQKAFMIELGEEGTPVADKAPIMLVKSGGAASPSP